MCSPRVFRDNTGMSARIYHFSDGFYLKVFGGPVAITGLYSRFSSAKRAMQRHGINWVEVA